MTQALIIPQLTHSEDPPAHSEGLAALLRSHFLLRFLNQPPHLIYFSSNSNSKRRCYE